MFAACQKRGTKEGGTEGKRALGRMGEVQRRRGESSGEGRYFFDDGARHAMMVSSLVRLLAYTSL